MSIYCITLKSIPIFSLNDAIVNNCFIFIPRFLLLAYNNTTDFLDYSFILKPYKIYLLILVAIFQLLRIFLCNLTALIWYNKALLSPAFNRNALLERKENKEECKTMVRSGIQNHWMDIQVQYFPFNSGLENSRENPELDGEKFNDLFPLHLKKQTDF